MVSPCHSRTDSTELGSRKTLVSQATATSHINASTPTLRFSVCNGFTNQRLAILYGIVLAVKTNRVAVLPDLMDDGIQFTDTDVTPTANDTQSFSDFYDVAHFTSSLQAAGIPLLLQSDSPPAPSYIQVSMKQLGQDPVKALTASRFSAVPHIALDCPLFKMQLSGFSPEDEKLLWQVLQAFAPSRANEQLVRKAMDAISRVPAPRQAVAVATSDGSAHQISDGQNHMGKYNMLHLRFERDWQEHCKRWGSNTILGRDNCMNNTEEIDQTLLLFNIPRDVPLYVGSYWKGTDPELADKILGRVRAAGYRIVQLEDILPSVAALPREKLAMLDFGIAMGADR